MARTSQRDQLGRLQRRIGVARKYRETEKFDETWTRMRDLYAGKHFDKPLGDEDRIMVNVSFSTLNVIYPAVSVSHPKTTVNAVNPEDADKAKITEVVLDCWWRNYGITPQFRLAVKDFLIFGHGWLKVGYRFREREQQRNAQAFADDVAAQMRQADEFAADNPDLASALPEPEDIAASVPATELVVTDDQPFVERVSPFDMFVDPEATCMENVKWMAQRIVRPIEEVRRDERYDTAMRNKVQPSTSVNESYMDQRRKTYGSDVERAVVWEFYDLINGTVAVFADGCNDGFLRKPQPFPFHFGHPFVMLRNYEVPDRFYPIGDLETLEPIQQELNKTRSQLMNARRQYKRKFLYSRDAFDNAALQALTSEQDGALVGVDGGQPLNQVLYPAPVNPIPPELFNYSQAITSDLDRVSGVSEYQMGVAPQVRRTATEASMIQDAVQARSTDKLNEIELAVTEISKRLIALARQFLTGEQVASFAGVGGKRVWVPFSHADIDADFMFEVQGGSTAAHNEAWERQQAMDLMQAVMPFAQSGVVDPRPVVMFVLSKFGIDNPQQFLAPPQPQGLPPGAAPPGGPQGGPPGAGGPPGPPQGGPPPDLAALLGGSPGGGPPPQLPPELLAQMIPNTGSAA